MDTSRRLVLVATHGPDAGGVDIAPLARGWLRDETLWRPATGNRFFIPTPARYAAIKGLGDGLPAWTAAMLEGALVFRGRASLLAVWQDGLLAHMPHEYVAEHPFGVHAVDNLAATTGFAYAGGGIFFAHLPKGCRGPTGHAQIQTLMDLPPWVRPLIGGARFVEKSASPVRAPQGGRRTGPRPGY